MEYLKKHSKPAKPDGRCRRHPKHTQSPGVCSICLSEKLSQLSGGASSSSSSSFVTLDSSSSSVSSCSLSSSSSSLSCPHSPVHRFRYNGNGKKASGSLSLLLSGKNVLTKSRSLVFISSNKGDKENCDNQNDRSFLSKFLLRPRKKKAEEGAAHSRTMRSFMLN